VPTADLSPTTTADDASAHPAPPNGGGETTTTTTTLPSRATEERRATWRDVVRAAGELLLVMALVASLFHHRLINYVELVADPLAVNDDARPLILPYVRLHDPTLARGEDYIAQYVMDAMPIGYRALYTAAAAAWDPRWVSKVLPLGMLVVLLLAVGAAARRLGGLVAAGIAMALVLGSDIYIARLTGGLPRMFAYPMLACGAVALVTGRPLWLAALVPVASAFYPPAGVTLGLTLAVLLLLVPRADRGAAADWTFRRRAIVLVVTAAASALVLLPTTLRLRPYGPAVSFNRVDEFPENGPGGRYGPDDHGPFKPLSFYADRAFARTFLGPVPMASDAIAPTATTQPPPPAPAPLLETRPMLRARIRYGLVLTILGTLVLLFRRDRATRRLLALAAAGVIGDAMARLFAPHMLLPQRHSIYPIPTYLAVLFPAGLVALTAWIGGLLAARGWAWARRAAPVVAIALATLLIVPMRLYATGETGYSVRIDPADPVTRAVAALPSDVLIAGWPRRTMSNLPYLTGRRVYLDLEMHQAFHATYGLEMRRRMRLVVDAYYAKDLAPLRRLRDEEGVTHFLVDRRHFVGDPPEYFAPYDEWIAAADAALGDGPPAALAPDVVGWAAILDQGPWVLLDLSRLPPS